jgi:hypothetical protein
MQSQSGMGQALIAGAIVALFLFIWKKWLKPALGLGQALCQIRPRIVVNQQKPPEQVQVSPPQVSVQPTPQQQQAPPAQQPVQQQTESYADYY